MKRLVLLIARWINRMLFLMRLRVVALPKDYYDLALYPIAKRPVLPMYLNIGALDFHHPLWHNLDNPTAWDAFAARQWGNVDVAYDLMSGKPIAVADNSLSIAYSSHVIEHLRDEDVRLLFREVHRMLAPGGTLRVVAPDMDVFLDAYWRGDEVLFGTGLVIYDCRSIEQKLLQQFASALVHQHPQTVHRKPTDQEIRDAVATKEPTEFYEHFSRQVPLEVQGTHRADHLNWFTPDKTIAMLHEAGFTKVRRSACGQSHHPVLRNRFLFDPYESHSLYVECDK